MAVRDDRGDVRQTTPGFRGPLMVQSLTSAKSKFLSLDLLINNNSTLKGVDSFIDSRGSIRVAKWIQNYMDLSNQNLNYTDALEIASNNYKKAFGNSNVVKIPDEIILNKGKINCWQYPSFKTNRIAI